MSPSDVEKAQGLNVFAGQYDLLLCDVWGVLHNGLTAFDAARSALAKFRQSGAGQVILLTNAPRPDWWIKRQLAELEIISDSYDAIVTSGDVTRHAIEEHGAVKLFALGPERDRNFYDGLSAHLVEAEKAELISITGLVDDEVETPDDYEGMLSDFLARDLKVICANPDIVVERGDRLVYCGGALAEKYREMGGDARYFGKPHKPIYDRALSVAADLMGQTINKNRVLAIGDGVMTDVKGANEAGLDCLFVTGGIHAAENGPLSNPTPQGVGQFLAEKERSARAFMPELIW